MKEHIYTIPLNEQFDKTGSCPFCDLYKKYEQIEIDRITGASMMEPSVRIETNKVGFCYDHFLKISKSGKRLPVALIIQSHLEEIRSKTEKSSASNQSKFIQNLNCSCYVCDRLNKNFESLFDNYFYLYENDERFRENVFKQKGFCFPHYGKLLSFGEKKLSKKRYKEFAEKIISLENEYLNELQGDIDWFCKKFDYQFAKEDWKNSKDAIERSINFLSGKNINSEMENN